MLEPLFSQEGFCFWDIGSTATYSLMWVCKHIGESSVGGHYTATCRLGDGSWRAYNDKLVSIPSGAIADGAEACLLFYIQKDTGAGSAV